MRPDANLFITAFSNKGTNRGKVVSSENPRFGKQELKILGLARHFDFLIRLCERDAYHKIINGDTEILATYAHEWTHYIQYLSTFLGNFLADNERNIHFTKHALVILVSKALAGIFTTPVLDLLYSDDRLLDNSEYVITEKTWKYWWLANQPSVSRGQRKSEGFHRA